MRPSNRCIASFSLTVPAGRYCRDQKLTKKERAELDYKKEVLRLAKEKQRHLAEIEDKEVYRMPDSYEEAGAKRRNQQLDLLTARYQCAPSPTPPSCRRPVFLPLWWSAVWPFDAGLTSMLDVCPGPSRRFCAPSNTLSVCPGPRCCIASLLTLQGA
jgi:hypothetical protein